MVEGELGIWCFALRLAREVLVGRSWAGRGVPSREGSTGSPSCSIYDRVGSISRESSFGVQGLRLPAHSDRVISVGPDVGSVPHAKKPSWPVIHGVRRGLPGVTASATALCGAMRVARFGGRDSPRQIPASFGPCSCLLVGKMIHARGIDSASLDGNIYPCARRCWMLPKKV